MVRKMYLSMLSNPCDAMPVIGEMAYSKTKQMEVKVIALSNCRTPFLYSCSYEQKCDTGIMTGYYLESATTLIFTGRKCKDYDGLIAAKNKFQCPEQ